MTDALSAGVTMPATGRRLVPPSWPLWPLPGLLVLWLLGLTYLIWPIVGVMMFAALAVRGPVSVPRRFGIWLLFLAWVVISATQLSGVDRAMSYLYRFSMYFSATALFVYLYNMPRRDVSWRRIVNVLAIGWAMVVIGGLLGIVAAGLQLHSPLELVLPKNLLDIPLVHDMVTPAFSKENAFPGLGIHRTQAPFPYPNAWGSNFVLLTPFALFAFLHTARRSWKIVLGGLLLASVVPFFFSLDRGAWLALAVGLTYGGIRLVVHLDLRTVRWFALGGVLLVFLIIFTPLNKVLERRLDSGYSDEGRIGRNLVAIDLVLAKPLLGYGAPQDSEYNPANAAVGTHGQLWLVLVSQGVPGGFLYMGWLFYLLGRSGRRLRSASDLRFWPHLTIFMAIIMTPYYELLPLQMHTIMVAAVLILRDGVPETHRFRPMLVPERARPRESV